MLIKNSLKYDWHMQCCIVATRQCVRVPWGGGAVQVTFSHIKVDFLDSGHAVSPIMCSKFQRKQKLCVSNFLVHPHIGRKSRVFLPSLFGGFFSVG